MIKSQLFIAAALFVGVAIGYCAKSTAPAAAPAEAPKAARVAAPADKGEAASVAALRARVAELERLLAQQSSAAGTSSVAQVVKTAAPAENMRERLARMEKENPAQYAQMTNRFAQFHRRRTEQAQSRLDFLSSIETAGMSAAARRTHQTLQETIVQREELREKMADRDLSDEERRGLWEEMRKIDHTLRDLNRKERDNLLSQTAKALGLKGADAAELTSTIKGIFDATDERQWGAPRRGRR